MRLPQLSQRSVALGLLVCLLFVNRTFGSAYNARPKLIVVIVIDQFRGDYLERYRDQFGEGGFRLLLDHGANFTDCDYNYANTRTAPGHATLFSGAYSDGHGIMANEWWDPQKRRMVTSVEDEGTKIVGLASNSPGASPHNLLSDTLGDELKLATQGKSRVFGIALKDRAAVFPAGFAGDGAYWIDHKSGAWLTSSYYRSELPKWVQDFNDSKRGDKYLNLEWKDQDGNILRTTKPAPDKESNFYELVGFTPFANDYELEFARELITYEKLGGGPATDLLTIGLSANDHLGHKVGPDSPEMRAMVLATDRQLAAFFDFLGHQIGLANIWIVLSADHGIAPLPSVATALRIPAAGLSSEKFRAGLNQSLSKTLGRPADYVQNFDYPLAWLNQEAFVSLKVKEDDAEQDVGEALKQAGLRGYFTRSQLRDGSVANTPTGVKYANSYSPLGGWYVIGVPVPYTVGVTSGTDHASPYTYDTHVPLSFYGFPFQPGAYRTHAEPVDMAVTLASLLGINAPTHAVGRVLTEALAQPHGAESSSHAPGVGVPQSPKPAGDIKSVGTAAGGFR